jgi:hypothetical protein
MHYMIPPERRLPEAPGLVEQLGYFVVHALRPTGKTTALRALAEHLSASGKYAAVLLSCEAGQAAGDDFDAAERIVVSRLRGEAESALAPAPLRAHWRQCLLYGFLNDRTGAPSTQSSNRSASNGLFVSVFGLMGLPHVLSRIGCVVPKDPQPVAVRASEHRIARAIDDLRINLTGERVELHVGH